MLIIWPNHLQYLSTHAIILAASSLLAFEKNKMSSAYIMWVMAGPPLLALIPLTLLEAGAELSVQPGGPRPLQKFYKIVYCRLKTKIVTQYVLFFMSWPPFPPNTHNHLSMSLTSLKIAFPNTQPLHQPSKSTLAQFLFHSTPEINFHFPVLYFFSHEPLNSNKKSHLGAIFLLSLFIEFH